VIANLYSNSPLSMTPYPRAQAVKNSDKEMAGSAVTEKWVIRVQVLSAFTCIAVLFMIAILAIRQDALATAIDKESEQISVAKILFGDGCTLAHVDADTACEKHELAVTNLCQAHATLLGLMSTQEAEVTYHDDLAKLMVSAFQECDNATKAHTECMKKVNETVANCEWMKRYANSSAVGNVLSKMCSNDLSPFDLFSIAACELVRDNGALHWIALSTVVCLFLCLFVSALFVNYPHYAPAFAAIFCRSCFKILNGTGSPVYQIDSRCCCLRWVFKEQSATVMTAAVPRVAQKKD